MSDLRVTYAVLSVPYPPAWEAWFRPSPASKRLSCLSPAGEQEPWQLPESFPQAAAVLEVGVQDFRACFISVDDDGSWKEGGKQRQEGVAACSSQYLLPFLLLFVYTDEIAPGGSPSQAESLRTVNAFDTPWPCQRSSPMI